MERNQETGNRQTSRQIEYCNSRPHAHQMLIIVKTLCIVFTSIHAFLYALLITSSCTSHVHSKCYHSLVQLVMDSESTSDMAAKERAWGVLEEVLKLMEKNKVNS